MRNDNKRSLWELILPTGFSNKTKNKKRVLDLINHHPCFSEVHLWKTTKMDSLQIEDASKKEMTKEYLRIVCSVCEHYIEQFKNMNVDQMCVAVSYNSVPFAICEVLKEIHQKASVKGIPYLFLEKIDAVISHHIELMADSINNLQLYRDWDSPEDKVLATLDILYTTVRIIGDDVPNIVNSMNGELKMMLKGSRFDKHQ